MNILILGSSGQLGKCLQDISIEESKNNYYYTSRKSDVYPLDITDTEAVENFIKEYNISLIVNCAAYTNVEYAEKKEQAQCSKINHFSVKILSNLCKLYNVKLIHISTDYVFSGYSSIPYNTNERQLPINHYGMSKEYGELSIEKSNCDYMIIRTSWLYSEYGNNFVNKMIYLLKEKETIKVVYDQTGSPTYAKHLAKFIIEIIENNEFKRGIWHYSNSGVASWFDFAQAIFLLSENNFCYKCKSIIPCLSYEFKTEAQRPNYSVLNCSNTDENFTHNRIYWVEALKECLDNISKK